MVLNLGFMASQIQYTFLLREHSRRATTIVINPKHVNENMEAVMQQVEPNIRKKIQQLRDLRYAVEAEEFGDLSDCLTDAEDFRSLCLEIAEEAVEREAHAEAMEARIHDLQARKQ